MLYTSCGMGCSKPGFTHSRYQLQKSSQINEYKVLSASLSLNCCIKLVKEIFTSCSLLSNHSNANVSEGCMAVLSALCSHIFTSFKAFHNLLLKWRPCSNEDSSNIKSLPAGDATNMPKRTASAPYCSMSNNKSGLLPSCLLIFLPNLSRTIPVKYTSLKGGNCLYS